MVQYGIACNTSLGYIYGTLGTNGVESILVIVDTTGVRYIYGISGTPGVRNTCIARRGYNCVTIGITWVRYNTVLLVSVRRSTSTSTVVRYK